jgi:hypothetical protein
MGDAGEYIPSYRVKESLYSKSFKTRPHFNLIKE